MYLSETKIIKSRVELRIAPGVSTHMRKILLIILFLNLNFCFAQTEIEQIELSDCALELTKEKVTYDPSYFSIDYPNGDVPSDKGVCTDVVIRAYRKIGIDLQKNVHEDMKGNFGSYPKIWGLKTTDKNIAVSYTHLTLPTIHLV